MSLCLLLVAGNLRLSWQRLNRTKGAMRLVPLSDCGREMPEVLNLKPQIPQIALHLPGIHVHVSWVPKHHSDPCPEGFCFNIHSAARVLVEGKPGHQQVAPESFRTGEVHSAPRPQGPKPRKRRWLVAKARVLKPGQAAGLWKSHGHLG